MGNDKDKPIAAATLAAFAELGKAVGAESLAISRPHDEEYKPCDEIGEDHEWEGATQPGTPNGPAEHFIWCAKCGKEKED